MGAGEFSPRVARMVFFERDGEACFRCRRPLRWHERGFSWSLHHRKPRGMGSSLDPIVGSASNAIPLCGHATSPDGCHHWAEKYRDTAREHGYLIPRNATTPEYAPTAVRVKDMYGQWWLLTESGRAVEVDGGSRT